MDAKKMSAEEIGALVDDAVATLEDGVDGLRLKWSLSDFAAALLAALPSAAAQAPMPAPNGLTSVPCAVAMDQNDRNSGWLFIPHVDGQWVTAAKLDPFSLKIIEHWNAARPSAALISAQAAGDAAQAPTQAEPKLVDLLRDVCHYADSVCGMLRSGGWPGKAEALERRIKAVIDYDGAAPLAAVKGDELPTQDWRGDFERRVGPVGFDLSREEFGGDYCHPDSSSAWLWYYSGRLDQIAGAGHAGA